MKSIIRNENDFPIGHKCDCGEDHIWPLYVAAHKREKLIHTCEKCGKKVELYELDIAGEC